MKIITTLILSSLTTILFAHNYVEILSNQCETELALSANPEYLRAESSVYVYEKSGYRLAKQGSNNFTCIVNRDNPHVLKPTCFDKEGTATIIPKILFMGGLLAKGIAVKEIYKRVKQGFESKQFISPKRSGVAYMLSRYNRPYNPKTNELLWFPPHVMFYAPNLTNEDIGHDMSKHNPKQPTPMIGYQGPHGYMIMISDDGKLRSEIDLPHCPHWVFADNPYNAGDINANK